MSYVGVFAHLQSLRLWQLCRCTTTNTLMELANISPLGSLYISRHGSESIIDAISILTAKTVAGISSNIVVKKEA